MLCIVIPILIIKNKLFMSSFLSILLVTFDRRYITIYCINMLMSTINFLRENF